MPRKKSTPVDESVSEPVAEIPQEPTPGEPAPKRRGRPRGSTTKVTEKAVRDQVESVLAIVGMVWATRDDLCAGVYLEHCVSPTADALAPMVAKNKALQKALASVGEGVKWIPAIRAWALLLATIKEHHGKPRQEHQGYQPEFTDEFLATGAAG